MYDADFLCEFYFSSFFAVCIISHDLESHEDSRLGDTQSPRGPQQPIFPAQVQTFLYRRSPIVFSFMMTIPPLRNYRRVFSTTHRP